ncbi:phasin family protein [Ruegeria sp. 2012CJ41-6]|uniref:Phasin family protein n=1 Tax=Ruegeria spongiae TaxID=2942209 RepID=A0ABT0PY11_9RHOB|nr:phasin family protein [Ruegeria spongiae]MCL6282465.1 phasin family protein [Ruegeria spongiae]
MATKATAPKTNAADTVSKATNSIANVSNTVSSLFGAYITSGRKLVEGVIEVDKTLLGYAKNSFDGYVALGKDTMQAKCLNDVIDLQAAHAHASIENGAANAREVVELSRTRAKEAYAPLKEVIDTYRSSKAA